MGPTTGEGYMVIGGALVLLGAGWTVLMDEVGVGFLGLVVSAVGGVALAVGIIAKGVHVGLRAHDEDRIDIARETAADVVDPDAID